VIRPIALADVVDEDRFGGKAASLGRSLRSRLPVPEGYGLDVETVDAIARDGASATGPCAELLATLGGHVAVRSSAIGEDAKDASFAGQHTTILNAASARADPRRRGRPRVGAHGLRPRVSRAHEHRRPAADRGGGPAADRRRLRRRAVHAQSDDGRARALDRGRVGAGEDRGVRAPSFPDSYRLDADGRVLERTIGVKDIALQLRRVRRHHRGRVDDARANAAVLTDAALADLHQLTYGMRGRCSAWTSTSSGRSRASACTCCSAARSPGEVRDTPAGCVFTGTFLAAALSPLGSTMIAVALPSISAELGVPGGALTQWLVRELSDRRHRGDEPGRQARRRHRTPKSLMIGMSVFGAGALLGFLVATLPALGIARIAMAIGGAMVVPATMALLRNTVPEERRPRTFGTMGAVMGTAAAIGPLVGGELTARFGWRAVFAANLPVIAVAFTLIHFSDTTAAPDTPARPRTPFDFTGAALVAGALTLLVAASRMKGAHMPWAALAGIVLLVAFVVWEWRAESPVMDLRLFARREFSAGSAVVGLQNLAMYALLFQIPIFFVQVRGIHSGAIGRVVIGMMIAMVVFAPIGGRLAERFGARPVALAGCLVSLVGALVLSDFSRLGAPRDALAGLILMGTGLGLANSPSQAAAMSAVTRSEAGMAAGALSTSRYVGGVVGITVLGTLLESNAGVPSHREAVLCYATALAVAAVMALMLPGRRRLVPSTEPAPTAVGR
jgi:MFS family permease